jgi:hypothetical protein
VMSEEQGVTRWHDAGSGCANAHNVTVCHLP